MRNADILKASLVALGRDGEAFAEDVLDDSRRVHPAAYAALEFTSGAELFAALERFVAQPDDAKAVATADPRPVAFADSLMKVFAKRLGRVRWTPGMALAWNTALREYGTALFRQ